MLSALIHLTKQAQRSLKKIKLQIDLLSNSLNSPVVLKFVFAFMHHFFQDQQIIKSLMLSYTCNSFQKARSVLTFVM